MLDQAVANVREIKYAQAAPGTLRCVAQGVPFPLLMLSPFKTASATLDSAVSVSNYSVNFSLIFVSSNFFIVIFHFYSGQHEDC